MKRCRFSRDTGEKLRETRSSDVIQIHRTLTFVQRRGPRFVKSPSMCVFVHCWGSGSHARHPIVPRQLRSAGTLVLFLDEQTFASVWHSRKPVVFHGTGDQLRSIERREKGYSSSQGKKETFWLQKDSTDVCSLSCCCTLDSHQTRFWMFRRLEINLRATLILRNYSSSDPHRMSREHQRENWISWSTLNEHRVHPFAFLHSPADALKSNGNIETSDGLRLSKISFSLCLGLTGFTKGHFVIGLLPLCLGEC